MARLYVQLDVDYADDPKIIEAGEKAELLYLRALCLSKRMLTDGYISESQLPRFGLSGVAARAKTLVDLNLWSPTADGYVITAWSKRNKSREQIERETAQRKMDALRGNHERWHKEKRVVSCPFCESGADRPPDSPHDRGGESTESESESESKTQTEVEPEIEVKTETSVVSSSCEELWDPPPGDDDRLTNLWKAWAHRELHKRRADGIEEPRSVAAWLTSVATDLAGQHLDAARALLAELPSADANELLDRLTAPPPDPNVADRCPDCSTFLPTRLCGRLSPDCERVIRGVA